MTRRWFITGGTPGGFGMAYAEVALEAGDRVVLTAQDRPQRWLILGNSAVIDALEKNLGDIR